MVVPIGAQVKQKCVKSGNGYETKCPIVSGVRVIFIIYDYVCKSFIRPNSWGG
jgi:hypothetical protein